MKRFTSVGFMALFISSAFGLGDLNPSTANDENSIYPVVIGGVMVVGAIVARLIALRKKAH